MFFRREYAGAPDRELARAAPGLSNVQEIELRRIERDLHDGAQARLVALGMNIGMAEEKLRTDPEGALALVAEARTGAARRWRSSATSTRHPSADPHGPRARGRDHRPRGPQPGSCRSTSASRAAAGPSRPRLLRRRRGARERDKHAEATHIDVAAGVDGMLVVEVADDGRGGADSPGPG